MATPSALRSSTTTGSCSCTFSSDVARGSLVSYDLATDTYETLLAAGVRADRPIRVRRGEARLLRHLRRPEDPGAPLRADAASPPARSCPRSCTSTAGRRGSGSAASTRSRSSSSTAAWSSSSPNIRGSTGYGVDFRDAAIKDWGGADLEDVAGGGRVPEDAAVRRPGPARRLRRQLRRIHGVHRRDEEARHLARRGRVGRRQRPAQALRRRAWSTSSTTSASRWAIPRRTARCGAIAARSSSRTSCARSC